MAVVEIRHTRSEAIKLQKPDKLEEPEVRGEELCVLEKQ